MEKIKILILEHDPSDLDLIIYEIKRSGIPYLAEIVNTERTFEKALIEFAPDIILSDYSLPTFNGTAAFYIRQKLAPATPFIFVSGNLEQESSIELIKNGLTDYVMKDKLSSLAFKVQRALRESREQASRMSEELYMRRNEARLKEAQRIAALGSWERDFSTGKYLWSEQLYLLLGFNPEHTGPSLENYFSVIHPEDADMVKNLIRDSEVYVKDISFEHRIIRPDGEVRYMYCETRNEVNKEGEAILRRHGIIQDITERKRVQQRMEMDGKNLKALINNTKDLMWSVDSDMKLITSNQAFEFFIRDRTGVQIEQGMSFFSMGLEEQHARFYERLFARALAGETFTVIEHGYSDHEFWNEISFYPIYHEDSIIGTACFSRDITERKLFDRELKESTQKIINFKNQLERSEKSLKQAQKLARLGNWESNLITGEVIWSDEVFDILAIDKRYEIPAVDVFLSCIHPDEKEHVRALVAKGEETLEGYSFNCRLYNRKGEEKYVYCTCRFILNDEGKPVSMSGIVHDITERNLARIEIEKSNERYELATMATNDIIWDWDVSSGNIFRSENYMSHFGYMPETIDIELDTWLLNIHKSDRDRVMRTLFEHLGSTQTDVWECEYRFFKSNGDMVHIRDKGHIVRDCNGKAIRMVGAMSDITREKLAEESMLRKQSRLNEAQALTHVGNWEVNFNTNESKWSDEAYRIYGLDPDSDHNLSPEEWLEFTHPDDREAVYADMVRSRDSLSDSVLYHRIIRKDGTERYLRSESKYEFDEAGQPVGLYGVVYDITEQKQAEEELKNLVSIMKEQNKRVQNFAYIVSHNIRSHSANMVGLMEAIMEAGKNEDREIFFNMMHTSTAKLSETIENLNEIITIHSDTDKERRELNLRLEVDKTCDAINAMILQTGARIINEVDESISLEAVPSYMESILLNLISNSIKYRSPDRICVIRITAVEDQGHIELSVIDNGMGIDLKKNGGKIFGMYKTFHNNSDARGIGLFMTKNQVEAMNGKIDVESAPGEGATFRISLLKKSAQV